jgi:hypothetical protein
MPPGLIIRSAFRLSLSTGPCVRTVDEDQVAAADIEAFVESLAVAEQLVNPRRLGGVRVVEGGKDRFRRRRASGTRSAPVTARIG